MEKLEEFFKNRASFNRSELNFSSLSSMLNFTTKNIYNPEDYSLDFLKEKIKPLCYYLYSFLKEPRVIKIRMYLDDLENENIHFYCREPIVSIGNILYPNNSFLQITKKICF